MTDTQVPVASLAVTCEHIPNYLRQGLVETEVLEQASIKPWLAGSQSIRRIAREQNARFPGFESDVHGLIIENDGDVTSYKVEVLKA